MEIHSIKNPTKAILEMENLGILQTTEASFTNRVQEIEEKIAGIEDMREKMNTSVQRQC